MLLLFFFRSANKRSIEILQQPALITLIKTASVMATSAAFKQCPLNWMDPVTNTAVKLIHPFHVHSHASPWCCKFHHLHSCLRVPLRPFTCSPWICYRLLTWQVFRSITHLEKEERICRIKMPFKQKLLWIILSKCRLQMKLLSVKVYLKNP